MKSSQNLIQIEEYFSAASAEVLKFLKYCFYGVFIYLDINHNQSLILMMFFAIDMGLGTWKSYTLNVPIQKQIFWEGLMKKLLVLVLPMLVALLGKGLGYDFKWLVDSVMKVLIASEFISCIANFLSIRTKKDIKNQDFISYLALALKDLATKIITGIIGNIKK